MKWLKHYSDARESNSLSRLILDLGIEGYGRYWILLEFLASKFDGENTTFSFHPSIIRGLLRLRSATQLKQVADRLATVRGIKLELSPNEIKIEAPILLELQDRDFKKARSLREQGAPKNKIKNKEKDLEVDKELKGVTTSQPEHLPGVNEAFPEARDLLEFWNTKDIIQHIASDKNLCEISKELEKRTKTYSIAEIKVAIDNYSRVVHDPACYFKYKWSLSVFLLRKGATDFFPDRFVFENYLSKKPVTQQQLALHQSAPERRQSKMVGMLRPVGGKDE